MDRNARRRALGPASSSSTPTRRPCRRRSLETRSSRPVPKNGLGGIASANALSCVTRWSSRSGTARSSAMCSTSDVRRYRRPFPNSQDKPLFWRVMTENEPTPGQSRTKRDRCRVCPASAGRRKAPPSGAARSARCRPYRRKVIRGRKRTCSSRAVDRFQSASCPGSGKKLQGSPDACRRRPTRPHCFPRDPASHRTPEPPRGRSRQQDRGSVGRHRLPLEKRPLQA